MVVADLAAMNLAEVMLMVLNGLAVLVVVIAVLFCHAFSTSQNRVFAASSFSVRNRKCNSSHKEIEVIYIVKTPCCRYYGKVNNSKNG